MDRYLSYPFLIHPATFHVKIGPPTPPPRAARVAGENRPTHRIRVVMDDVPSAGLDGDLA
jgi:hypothetical protein